MSKHGGQTIQTFPTQDVLCEKLTSFDQDLSERLLWESEINIKRRWKVMKANVWKWNAMCFPCCKISFRLRLWCLLRKSTMFCSFYESNWSLSELLKFTQYPLILPRSEKHYRTDNYLVNSIDRESSQQLLNVVFWTFFLAKTCCVVCHAYCLCYGGTNMARKNVWKTTFHSTFEMIEL